MLTQWLGRMWAVGSIGALSALCAPTGAAEPCRTAPPDIRLPPSGGAPSPDAARPSVHLVWHDVNRAAPSAAYGEMVAEVDRILDGMGINACWVRGEVGRTQTGPDAIQVILLNEQPARGAMDPRVLGVVESHATPPGRVWLYFPNVVWALGLDPLGAGHWASWQNQELAVALGHVVVHELIHLALPTEPHAHHGLMAPRAGRGELLSARPWLNPALRSAFVARLGRRPSPTSAALSISLPYPGERSGRAYR